MRRLHISLIIALLLSSISLLAQVPQSINYQAMAFNGTTVYANQTFDIRFTLHLNNTTIYEEVHPSTTSNSQGLFVLKIGEGVPSIGTFAGIDWSGGPYSLRTELDPGSGYVLISDHSFSSVPYALFAERSILPVGSEFTFNNDTLQIAQNGATLGQILKWNGQAWVPDFDASNTYVAGTGINVSGSVISNIGDTDPTDDILTTSIAGGDVTGTFSNLSVVGIQGFGVSNTAPTNNDVLKWNATTSLWEAKPDAVGSGGAFNITARLSGDGSIGSPLDIAQNGATNGQVLKWNNIANAWAPANDSGQVYGLQLVGNNLTLVPGGSTGSVSLGSQYNAGPGINLVGGTIVNTGDIDPSDDITTATSAGGDVSGTFPTLTVNGLQGNAVSSTVPASGEVLTWDGTAWIPATVIGTAITAGPGLNMVGGTIINTGDIDASDDITTSTIAGGDLSGLYPNPTVNGLAGFPLSSQSPGLNQILKFNGTTWVPDTDDDTDADADPTNEIQMMVLTGNTLSLSGGGNSVNLPAYFGGPGISVSGNIISNTGDLDPSDDITNSTAAGGDLSGVYPNPVVVAINGFSVANSTPLVGQVYKWNGTQWIPSTDAVNDADADPNNEIQSLAITGGNISISGGNSVSLPVYFPSAGIDITNNIITNTGDTDPSDDITTSTVAGGDASGTFSALTVNGLQGNPLSNTIPTTGEVLKWDGTQWSPGADAVNDADADPTNEIQSMSLTGNTLSLSGGGNSVNLPIYLQGPGINITNNVVSNTGDLNPNDDVTFATAAGGDLAGVYPNPIVSAINGFSIANTTPTTGQVYKWNGTQWTPSNDETGPWTETAGTAIHDGDIFLQNGSGQTRVAAGISPNDRGYINVYDEFNNLKAGIQINASGQGEVFGDSKTFRMEHPEDPSKEIWYANLEGPEAGAYVRGTAELVNGIASINFPHHFQLIATADNMTIMLTPLSGDSEGLAVIEKTANGFQVRELRGGTGSYRFDWEAKCIRQGYENFEVIRERK